MRKFNVKPAPKVARSASLFTRDKILKLVLAYVLRCCLNGSPFTSRNAFDAVPKFAQVGMRRANAVGDALGHGHGGACLHPVTPNSNLHAGSFENAGLMLNLFSNDANLLADTAIDLEFDSVDELFNAVSALREDDDNDGGNDDGDLIATASPDDDPDADENDEKNVNDAIVEDEDDAGEVEDLLAEIAAG